MALHSLFDKRRKQEIKDGIAKGRLDLNRRRKDADSAFDNADTIKIPAEVMEKKISADAPVHVPQPDQQPLLPPSPPVGAEENSPEYTTMVPLLKPQDAGKPAKTAFFGLDPNRSVKGKILGKGPTPSPSAGMAPVVEGLAINPQDGLDFALFDAIRSRDYLAVEAAIKQGADVNAVKMVSLTPNAGMGDRHMWAQQTPLDAAKGEGDGRIVRLLKKHGAKE